MLKFPIEYFVLTDHLVHIRMCEDVLFIIFINLTQLYILKIKQQYISKIIYFFFCKEHADFNEFYIAVRINKTILHRALSMPYYTFEERKRVFNLICEPVITKDSKSNDGF